MVSWWLHTLHRLRITYFDTIHEMKQLYSITCHKARHSDIKYEIIDDTHIRYYSNRSTYPFYFNAKLTRKGIFNYINCARTYTIHRILIHVLAQTSSLFSRVYALKRIKVKLYSNAKVVKDRSSVKGVSEMYSQSQGTFVGAHMSRLFFHPTTFFINSYNALVRDGVKVLYFDRNANFIVFSFRWKRSIFHHCTQTRRDVLKFYAHTGVFYELAKTQ